MSEWLDENRQVLDWVAADLHQHEVKPTGRAGLPVESVLRCALLKQHRQLIDEELAFHLLDSASFQAFARLPLHWVPKKSALQQAVATIKASTWERINQVLVGTARAEGIERAERARIDSTVTEAPIHEPSDSRLMWDGVRVLRTRTSLISKRNRSHPPSRRAIARANSERYWMLMRGEVLKSPYVCGVLPYFRLR